MLVYLLSYKEQIFTEELKLNNQDKWKSLRRDRELIKIY